MATDLVAAYLEQVQKLAADERADIGLAAEDTGSSADHIPRLAAALEAVLALHRPDREDSGWCAYDAFSWPCREYREISAALLGEAGTDA